MVAFKLYGGQKQNVPKNEEGKNKIVVVWYISELLNVLFKRTPYKAKTKWLKNCKTIAINKILLVLRKSITPPAWNAVPKFLLDATLTILQKIFIIIMQYTKLLGQRFTCIVL